MEEFLYFFIAYPRFQEENPNNIYFRNPRKKEDNPELYYSDHEKINKTYHYKKIFKAKIHKSSKYEFSFLIGDDKYEITFDSGGDKFIYDVSLEYGLKIINVRRKIPQNKIEYKDKMEFFIKAIKEKEDEKTIEKKFDDLFKDTIKSYSKKKGFHFFFFFFLKVFKKEKLCKELIKHFKETDEKSKINNMEKRDF